MASEMTEKSDKVLEVWLVWKNVYRLTKIKAMPNGQWPHPLASRWHQDGV